VDNQALQLIKKVWRHNGVDGYVWLPHISNINKPGERFHEGPPLPADSTQLPEMRDSVDWYWTPAVSKTSASRKIKAGSKQQYPAQRAIWVDCDESYDDKLLQSLKPSYMWETSPGHKQAVWLMSEKIAPSEFHRDGFMGMLTQALGGDKSGVDIGQLLRVPSTVHHKHEPFQGTVLRNAGTVFTRGQVLSRVAKGLGFAPGLASELGADDPYGDRSKLLWKFSRNAAELGLAQDLTFKLIRATKWNKWRDEPERLKEDIARAYAHQPDVAVKDQEQQQAKDQHDNHDEVEEAEPWGMATVDEFGPVIRKPVSWVVPGIIPEAGCGLLVSAPKVGKTRIAIEMALGLATGRKPLGIDMARPLAVGFFSLEDGEYLFSSRLNSGINDSQGRQKYHWDGHITKSMTWEPPVSMSLFTNFAQIDLSDDMDKQRLFETINKYELKLVIIDTLSMAIGKSDVSNSKDMYAILKDIKTIAKSTGCAIMFIHHTRKRVFEKGESIQEMVLGSTALHAWSDFIMNLVAPAEDGDMLRLGVQTKMGNNLHYIDSKLKIVKHPPLEEETVA
jgi:hypothetical protein